MIMNPGFITIIKDGLKSLPRMNLFLYISITVPAKITATLT